MTDDILDEDIPEFSALDDDAPEDAVPPEDPEPSPKNDEANP